MLKEIWKDIVGYEGCYQVSNLGNVRRLDTLIMFKGTQGIRKGCDLKTTRNSRGYSTVVLCWKSKRKTKSVHRLVVEAFAIKIPGLELVNHLDGDTLHNWEGNLEWSNPQKNQLHAYATGLKGQGENSGMSKLKAGQVVEIKKRLKDTFRVSDHKLHKKIAKEYNVTPSTIKWIDKGRTWKSITVED